MLRVQVRTDIELSAQITDRNGVAIVPDEAMWTLHAPDGTVTALPHTCPVPGTYVAHAQVDRPGSWVATIQTDGPARARSTRIDVFPEPAVHP